jgi:UDP-3-O-[3-hydroxymyristoyl] glucosamine N-acyltransferase
MITSLKWGVVSLFERKKDISFIISQIANIDVEGSRIGNNNIVEARGRILGSTAVGNYCVIGSGCSTESNETIGDLTVIYGSQSKRRTQNEALSVS